MTSSFISKSGTHPLQFLYIEATFILVTLASLVFVVKFLWTAVCVGMQSLVCACVRVSVLIKGYLNMETMRTESRGSLLFCLHFPFVLFSSFDSVVGCFAVLSISPSFFRLLFLPVLHSVVCRDSRVSVIHPMIHCVFENPFHIRRIVCRMICITLHAFCDSSLDNFTLKIQLH